MDISQQPPKPQLSHRPWPGLGGVVLAVALVGVGLAVSSGCMRRTSSSTDTAPARGKTKASEDQPSAGPQVVSSDVLPVEMGPDWHQLDDPGRDGWNTEVFSERASDVLGDLGKLITQADAVTPEQTAELVTSDFHCPPLVPAKLETVLREEQGFHVERWPAAVDESGESAFQGAAGFADSLNRLAAPFRGARDVHYKFKLFRIQPGQPTITTTQYFALSGYTAQGMVELNSTWMIDWQPGSEEERPRIARIHIREFERSADPGRQEPLFADCTKSALGKNECYVTQFSYGLNHWFQRLQAANYYSMTGNPGLAVGDINGDGLEDLYVCQEEGLPNRLFVQQLDGSALEVSVQWGVDWLESSRSALLVDLDNDGDQDLAVAIEGGVIVAENDAQRFAIRSVLTMDEDTMSLSAADVDSDGDLDIYVCVYFPNEDMTQNPAAALGAGLTGTEVGGRNALFRNDVEQGEWKFTDVTSELGLDADNHRPSFAAAWEDYDNDGDLDLYVANDNGRNDLYRNDDGHFTDVTLESDADDKAFGMGVTWSDYDHDGWMDVYISNMFSAAGGRITFQDQFPVSDPQQKSEMQRYARGNTLLRNLGNGKFEDVSEQAGVAIGRWAWGSNFVDINNDSFDDLVVANGFITTEDSGDL